MMIKRIIDIVASMLGLVLLSPIFLVVMFLVWRQDMKSPFYVANRVGRGAVPFKMVKLRSMVVDADKSGVDSTSANDMRITPVGHFIRKYKLDELTQLWNVLLGDMSLVGPRPNVENETQAYTEVETRLLDVKPGITDFSSIVFSDEGDILDSFEDPDLSYNQIIRPWKSRLGLAYIDNQSMLLDIKLIIYTVVAVVSRQSALEWLTSELKRYNLDESIIEVSRRNKDLYPYPPPGADEIVMTR